MQKKCIQNAVRDLEHYQKKMKYCEEYFRFFVAFISSTEYIIFDNKFSEVPMCLNKKTFNIEESASKIEKNNIVLLMKKQIHEIHNYIRDNTKISGEDKSFFVSIILISIQKESFVKQIENYKSKRYIYDLMIENIKEFGIDASVFEFLRNDKKKGVLRRLF